MIRILVVVSVLLPMGLEAAELHGLFTNSLMSTGTKTGKGSSVAGWAGDVAVPQDAGVMRAALQEAFA